jgi:hypothetical protein
MLTKHECKSKMKGLQITTNACTDSAAKSSSIDDKDVNLMRKRFLNFGGSRTIGKLYVSGHCKRYTVKIKTIIKVKK